MGRAASSARNRWGSSWPVGPSAMVAVLAGAVGVRLVVVGAGLAGRSGGGRRDGGEDSRGVCGSMDVADHGGLVSGQVSRGRLGLPWLSWPLRPRPRRSSQRKQERPWWAGACSMPPLPARLRRPAPAPDPNGATRNRRRRLTLPASACAPRPPPPTRPRQLQTSLRLQARVLRRPASSTQEKRKDEWRKKEQGQE